MYCIIHCFRTRGPASRSERSVLVPSSPSHMGVPKALQLALLGGILGSSDALLPHLQGQTALYSAAPRHSAAAVASRWLRTPLARMMAEDGNGSPADGSSMTENGAPDLAAMSFEERLEYLASQAPTEKAPKKDDEGSMFGIDVSNAATQWWNPEFLGLCLQDLKEMQWPSRKQTFQTVVTSQIAFIIVLIAVLLADAFTEAGVRTLIQGKPFVVSIDAILKRPPTP